MTIQESYKEIINVFMNDKHFKKQVEQHLLPIHVLDYYLDNFLENIQSSKKLNRMRKEVDLFLCVLPVYEHKKEYKDLDKALIVIKSIFDPNNYQIEKKLTKKTVKIEHNRSIFLNYFSSRLLIHLDKQDRSKTSIMNFLYEEFLKEEDSSTLASFSGNALRHSIHPIYYSSTDTELLEKVQNALYYNKKQLMNHEGFNNSDFEKAFLSNGIDQKIVTELFEKNKKDQDYMLFVLRNHNIDSSKITEILKIHKDATNGIIEGIASHKNLDNEIVQFLIDILQNNIKTKKDTELMRRILLNDSISPEYLNIVGALYLEHIKKNQNYKYISELSYIQYFVRNPSLPVVFLHNLYNFVFTLKGKNTECEYHLKTIQDHPNYKKVASLVLNELMNTNT